MVVVWSARLGVAPSPYQREGQQGAKFKVAVRLEDAKRSRDNAHEGLDEVDRSLCAVLEALVLDRDKKTHRNNELTHKTDFHYYYYYYYYYYYFSDG